MEHSRSDTNGDESENVNHRLKHQTKDGHDSQDDKQYDSSLDVHNRGVKDHEDSEDEEPPPGGDRVGMDYDEDEEYGDVMLSTGMSLISALAPKICDYEESHVEVSASPAFQELDLVSDVV